MEAMHPRKRLKQTSLLMFTKKKSDPAKEVKPKEVKPMAAKVDHEEEESRGLCGTCGDPVYVSQERCRKGQTYYHAKCAPKPQGKSPAKPSTPNSKGPQDSIPGKPKHISLPLEYVDIWDKTHVRLPCSPRSKIKDVPRWDIIVESLSNLAAQGSNMSSYDIEEAIITYNPRYASSWRFAGLHAFCNTFSDENRQDLFGRVIPNMAKLAMQLPQLCQNGVPLLLQGKHEQVTLRRKQVASLLCNAFFCTIPGRNNKNSTLPPVNFYRLFESNQLKQASKLHCLFTYFSEIVSSTDDGKVCIKRIVGNDYPSWSEVRGPLCNLTVESEGTIEDDGNGMLQVDFANKSIGGGTLGYGSVQEEIRFLICPELILSSIVCEQLTESEAVVMIGAKRFSSYDGYGSSFAFKGAYNDQTIVDSGVIQTRIVAIDALRFSQRIEQFEREVMERELLKCWVGFSVPEPVSAVATGNWGCGVFGGDVGFKAVIQLIACSIAKKSMTYFTFGDEKLKTELEKFYEILQQYSVDIGELYDLLLDNLDLFKFSSDIPSVIVEQIQKQYTETQENNPIFDEFYKAATDNEDAMNSTQGTEKEEKEENLQTNDVPIDADKNGAEPIETPHENMDIGESKVTDKADNCEKGGSSPDLLHDGDSSSILGEDMANSYCEKHVSSYFADN
eukprot:m.3005 g.3005  ORF g.3005 m.3005 type:complete len:672 (+) comp2643_c0_seq1:232-2247(+)